jgi:hypothetical protein
VLDASGVLRCGALALPGALLADGTTPPAQALGCSIAGLSDVAAFAVDSEHGCAVHSDGRTSCWGTSDVGRPPEPLELPARATQLAFRVLGGDYALDASGAVWAWGENTEQAVPGRTERLIATPVRILP